MISSEGMRSDLDAGRKEEKAEKAYNCKIEKEQGLAILGERHSRKRAT
jgi:hypothetical protein